MLLFIKNSPIKPPCRVLIRSTLVCVILRIYTLLICCPIGVYLKYWNDICKSKSKNVNMKDYYHNELLILFDRDELCQGGMKTGILWAIAAPFISFDGERFLKIAKDDLRYNFEHNGPFFPGLPYAIHYSGNIFQFFYRKLVNSDVPPKIVSMAIGGLIMNNIALLLSSLVLYYVVLNFESGRYNDIAENVAFWYVMNPNTIHSISLYTEPIFSLIVNLSTLMLVKAENSNDKEGFGYELLGIILITISVFFRSNSIFMLIPLFFYKLRIWRYFDHFIAFNINREMIVDSIKSWSLSLIEAIVVVFPLIVFQIQLFKDFCGLKNNKLECVELVRPWCDKIIPISYSFIQKEYWNLGFLWFAKEVNNFFRLCYSLPVLIPAIELVYYRIKSLKMELNHLRTEDIGYFVSFFITLIVFIFFAQSEVIMRQTLSHHLFFIHISLLFKKNVIYSKIIKGMYILYFFIGATLFGLRIGWT